MRVGRIGLFIVLLVALSARVFAQTAAIQIEIVSDGAPVSGASVTINGIAHPAGADGRLQLDVAAGTVVIVAVKEGLAPASVTVDLRAGESRTVTIDLKPQEELEEHLTVVATRTDKRIEDQAMRVEVLDREEIEEKLMMTPGDIVMMLNEMGGLRVQATSPSLGAASVRIQGMRGRYTRFLSDGLPLFGEQVGSFGLLQIPPTDLAQVEVIKGVASSLYGAGAMGGVVNLVSRRPGMKREQELLVNRSTRGATDGVYWYSAPLTPQWGMTLLASAHGQQQNDVSGDGWADLPQYARGVVRPRIVWDNHAGRSLFATAGATWENRSGGTVAGAVLPVTGTPYREALDTRRVDAGAVGQTILGGDYVVTARASFAHARQHHRFGEIEERDVHDTAFGEIAVRHASGRQTWVVGAAVERDAFTPEDVPQFAYTYAAPGVFAQDDVAVSRWLSISASGRVDAHSRFGTFVSPRVSALLRANGWSSRLSFGTGFFAPTPLTEETEAAGLSRLIIPQPLKAERGRSLSLDLTRAAGPFSGTVTLFASRVLDPIEVDRDAAFVLRNLAEPATNTGVELLGTWRRAPFSATATYTFVRAVERPGDVDVSVPLTPRHSAGLVGMWERADTGRVGLEWYYTGEQRLEANPFRTEGRPYMVFGALVERRVGRCRLFVNAENLGGVRQTDWDPLIRPARGVDGRWAVDAWAPLDGRNVNGGLRVSF
jgi:iron complex outermembrane receptor protein